jgi:hypothetical protein
MLTPAVVSRAQISVLFHCELMSFLRVMMTTRKDKLDDGDMMVRVVVWQCRLLCPATHDRLTDFSCVSRLCQSTRAHFAIEFMTLILPNIICCTYVEFALPLMCTMVCTAIFFGFVSAGCSSAEFEKSVRKSKIDNLMAPHKLFISNYRSQMMIATYDCQSVYALLSFEP